LAQAVCLPDWIICGGESGGHARVMHPAWARPRARPMPSARRRVLSQAMGHVPQQPPLVHEEGLSPAEAQRRDLPANGKGGAVLDGHLWREFP
jgi:hypothetical protein